MKRLAAIYCRICRGQVKTLNWGTKYEAPEDDMKSGKMKVGLVFLATLYLVCLKLSDGIYTGRLDQGLAAIYDEFCPYHSKCSGVQGEKKVPPPGQVPCCMDCSCLDHCDILSNCCPDKLKSSSSVNSSNGASGGMLPGLTADMFNCRADKRKRDLRFNKLPRYYFMVDKCPAGKRYDDKRPLCEREPRSGFANSTPVIDETSKIIYASKHCAECHSAHNTTEWLTELDCTPVDFGSSGRSRYFPDTFDDVFSSASCILKYIPPLNVDDSQCTRFPLRSTCNTSGHWETYSESVEEACSKLYLPFSITYKNAYCAVCDGYIFSDRVCFVDGVAQGAVGFTAILVTKPDKSPGDTHTDNGRQNDRNPECSSGQMFDPYNNACRNVFCPKRKTMLEGRCVTLIRIHSAIMHVAVKMMTERVFFKSASLNTKVKLARNYLSFLTGERQDVSVLLRDIVETPETFSDSPYLVILTEIKVTDVPDIDIFSWIHERLETDFTFKMSTQRIFKFKTSILSTIDINYTRYNYFIFTESTFLTDLSTNTTLITLYHKDIENPGFVSTVGILISQLLFCKQVRLNESEFLNLGTHIVVSASNMSLFPGEYFRFERHGIFVQICESDYLSMADSFLKPQDKISSLKWYHTVLIVITGSCAVVICAGSLFYSVCVKRNIQLRS